MYVCMHACMYVCMCVCMHACMYVGMYVYMYVGRYVCACVRVYVCMDVFFFLNLYLSWYQHRQGRFSLLNQLVNTYRTNTEVIYYPRWSVTMCAPEYTSYSWHQKTEIHIIVLVNNLHEIGEGGGDVWSTLAFQTHICESNWRNMLVERLKC